MAVPRKKHTRRRTLNRRSQGHGKVELKQSATCSNCSKNVPPHKVCAHCGFYRGKKILAKLV